VAQIWGCRGTEACSARGMEAAATDTTAASGLFSSGQTLPGYRRRGHGRPRCPTQLHQKFGREAASGAAVWRPVEAEEERRAGMAGWERRPGTGCVTRKTGKESSGRGRLVSGARFELSRCPSAISVSALLPCGHARRALGQRGHNCGGQAGAGRGEASRERKANGPLIPLGPHVILCLGPLTMTYLTAFLEWHRRDQENKTVAEGYIFNGREGKSIASDGTEGIFFFF
jgi:hypothetical protein